VSRDLLVRGGAWKTQEQAYGGLSATTKHRLGHAAGEKCCLEQRAF
jgi:hypothetical protein